LSIPRARFEFVKEKYGLHASWAIWPSAGSTPKSNMDNLSIFDEEDALLKLQPDIILVGLNFSKSGVVTNPFQNFHGSGGGAYKIRYALEGTPLWGAYMTDIIKDFPEEESKNVMSYLRANPSVVSENVMSFQQEVRDLGAVWPTVVAFGGDAFNILNKALGSDYRVSKVIHYSHYMSKEKYREHIADQLTKITG
jgi:hypothetical protein